MNVYDSFVEIVNEHRGRRAVIYLGEVLTYGDLFEGVECFSTGLLSLGIKERDKIILYMPNTPQWIIALAFHSKNRRSCRAHCAHLHVP